MAANKCTSSAGHFDGHDSALERYRWHCPMRHVHGYSGSHWTPASGDYLLRIAPAAAKATCIQTTINKYNCKAGHFYGHGNVPVCNRAHRPMEEVQSFTRSHWTPPSGEYYAQNIVRTWLQHFFRCFHCKNRRKRSRVDTKNPVFNRGMTYQMKEKGLIKVSI